MSPYMQIVSSWKKKLTNLCLLDDLNILHNILSDTKITDNLNKNLYFVSILKTFSNFTEIKMSKKNKLFQP